MPYVPPYYAATLTAETYYDQLFASNPVIEKPECPDTTSRSRKSSPQVQSTGYSKAYDYTTPAIGNLDLKYDGDSIVSISDAYLQVLVGTVLGSCVQLVVEIPEINYSKTIVLNCPLLDEDPGGNDGLGSRTKKGKGPVPLTVLDTVTDYRLKLTLNDSLSSLRTALQSGGITVRFSVTTPGAKVTRSRIEQRGSSTASDN